MFKLLRYFSITSAVALLLVTVVLASLYRHLAVQQMIQQGETANVSLTQLLSNTIWPGFAQHLASTPGLANDELRAHPETARVRKAILAYARGLPVSVI